jgi:hypothetical protein
MDHLKFTIKNILRWLVNKNVNVYIEIDAFDSTIKPIVSLVKLTNDNIEDIDKKTLELENKLKEFNEIKAKLNDSQFLKNMNISDGKKTSILNKIAIKEQHILAEKQNSIDKIEKNFKNIDATDRKITTKLDTKLTNPDNYKYQKNIDKLYNYIFHNIVNDGFDNLKYENFDILTYENLWKNYNDNNMNLHLKSLEYLNQYVKDYKNTKNIEQFNDKIKIINNIYKKAINPLIRDYEELPEFNSPTINPLLYDTMYIISHVITIVISKNIYYVILKYIKKYIEQLVPDSDTKETEVNNYIQNIFNYKRNNRNLIQYIFGEMPVLITKSVLGIYNDENDLEVNKLDDNKMKFYEEILAYINNNTAFPPITNNQQFIKVMKDEVFKYYNNMNDYLIKQMKEYCDNYYKFILHEGKLLEIMDLFNNKAIKEKSIN